MTFAEYNKVNFQYPQGTKFKQSMIISSNSGSNVFDHIINPSVVVYGWIPVKGDGNTLNSGTMFGAKATGSPVNVALLDYYEKIRCANSSLSAYSAADIGKVLFALESLYGLLAEEETDIISLVDNRYDTYAHRGLLRKALWSNPKLAADNISNYISRHNLQAKKLQAFPFVPGIPFLKDHLDWAGKVYTDDNLNKSAIYLFRRSGFYYWEVKATDPDPGVLMLRDADLNTNSYARIDRPFTAEERFNIVDFLIDSYLIDDDLANIASEIYKAYGLKPEEYHVNTLPQDVSGIKIEECYDLDMIDSIKNSDFCFLSNPSQSVCIYGITEDTNGNLVYAVGNASSTTDVFPVDAIARVGSDYTLLDTGQGRVLYSYEENPSAEAIRDLCRFTHNYKSINAYRSYVYGLKTEFLTSVTIHWYDPDMVVPFQSMMLDRFISDYSPSITDLMQRLNPLTALPVIYQISITNGLYTGNYYPYRKDIDNMGMIDNNALQIYAEIEMCYAFFTTSKQSKYAGKSEKKRSKKAKKEDQGKGSPAE